MTTQSVTFTVTNPTPTATPVGMESTMIDYTYDQANRLKQATQGANTYTFAYNGVGDRLSQTVGITTTHYVLDPAAGLTQVLADGTNTYLYGPSTASPSLRGSSSLGIFYCTPLRAG